MSKTSLFEHATASTLRALSGDKEVAVAFRPANYHYMPHIDEDKEVILPVLSYRPTLFEKLALRGIADAVALKVRYHDQAIHRQHAFSHPNAQAIFNAAEQARVEALGIRNFRGVEHNLSTRLKQYCLNQGYSEMQHLSASAMADLVAMLIRVELTGLTPPDTASALMQTHGAAIKGQIRVELSELSNVLEDQHAYANIVQKIIHILEGEKEEINPAGEETKESETLHADSDITEEEEQDTQEQDVVSTSDITKPAFPEENQEKSLPETVKEYVTDHSDENIESSGFQSEPTGSNYFDIPGYHIFTHKYDEIITPDHMCSEQELTILRSQLDLKLDQIKNLTQRSAHKLMRELMTHHVLTNAYHLEEGVLDSVKLPTLVADPLYPLPYKWEKWEETMDTVVTILLDNSGSMRGRPIMVAALCADILSRTLERCGIKVEILGFTTADWKGGRSRKLWEKMERPLHPGRLNDIRHIIYKEADTPWRRARLNLGLMLKEGLLKENIDGEAIIWAYQRLKMRHEARRILMVVSDGAPVDDSTNSLNHSGYLDQHLHEVIRQVESQGLVELMAIGIGHDVGRYYKRAVTIKEVDELGSTMFRELASLVKQQSKF